MHSGLHTSPCLDFVNFPALGEKGALRYMYREECVTYYRWGNASLKLALFHKLKTIEKIC